MGKDVVGARLKLDTSKMLPAFQAIDRGAKGNAETFKVLNQEINVTTKNYTALAGAADKLALTSEDRRKKIMAESDALVKQRNAQTALIKAKKSQLDQTNQLVDAKLAAQMAIVVKRENAIEQQEREHLKRMEALQNRANKTAGSSSTGTSSTADSTRERVLREEQSIRQKLAQMEEKEAQLARKTAAEREAAVRSQEQKEIQMRERVLQEEQKIRAALKAREQQEANIRERIIQEEQKVRRALVTREQQEIKMRERILAEEKKVLQSLISTENQMNHMGKNTGFLTQIKDAAIHAAVFHTVFRSMMTVQEAMKEGIVDIESNMAGYVQTNEHYFLEYNQGTGEMVMNTKLLNAETEKFIHTTHDLGSEITDVTESARLWGRMYKDAGIVQEMVRKSTMLSTVDLVSLEDATKSMESTLAQYGVQIKDANDAAVLGGRILDSWSKVAHDTMAPAQDLGAAFERTGKIAAETGVSFDVMNGLISSGIRNTALSGENLGNMWKTVLGTIRTDKAVAEIESLGVATKEVVDGTEQWRRADDILLDLSTKVIDKNYDLTKSYADISRGVYQYAKLAASLNAGDILLGTAASIGSTGSTLEYLKVQMDTISRKAAQAKASLLEIFNQAGDDGLRAAIKKSLDVIDQLLIGLTKIPKGAFAATATLGGLLGLYKLIAPLLTQWRAAQTALNTAIAMHTTLQTAATAEMVVYTAAAKVAMATTAAWTAGLTLLVGAIAVFVYQSGKAEKAQREHAQAMKDEDAASQQMISQLQRQIELLPKLVNAHKSLESSLQSANLSEQKQTQIKKQLHEVSKALVITLGEEGAKQLETAGYTDEAVQIQVKALNQLIEKQNEARMNVLADQQNQVNKDLEKNLAEINKAKDKLNNLKTSLLAQTGQFVKNVFTFKDLDDSSKSVKALEDKIASLTVKNNELNASSADLGVQMSSLILQEDQFAGKAGTASESASDQAEVLADLREQIDGNGSAISEMNTLLKEMTGEQSMNASAAAELILKYPQLATEIYKTADGWKFEKDAVEVLRKAKVQKAIDDLKSEKASTFNTRLATDERLKAYGIEAEAIKSLADLKAAMNGVTSTTLTTGDDLKYFKPSFRDQGGALDEKAKQEAAAKSELDKIYDSYAKEQIDYQNKINALSGLYKDPNFGVSADSDKKSKSGKSDAEKDAETAAKEAATARKEAYSEDLDNFKYIAERQNWTIDQQAAGYERLKKRHAAYLAEDKDAMKQWSRDVVALSDARYTEDVANLEKKTERMRQANLQEVEMVKASLDFYTKEAKKTYLTAEQKAEADKQGYDLTKQYNELRYTNSTNWIDKEANKMEMGGKKKVEIINMELQAYERMAKDKNRSAEENLKLEQNIYEQKKALIEQQFSDSQKDISHRKAIGELTAAQELQEWQKIQAMYRVGTEQRMEADEQVYALRQKLIEDETKSVETLASSYKSKIEATRDAAVKAIEAERDAYLAGKDAEIQAIDDLLSKQQELNEDQDYESALAEKQARLALLASAVGPDGIAERVQVQKDIEKLQLDHERELAKRSLEEQKQALQDEKDAKKTAYDKDIETAKSHYEDLISAFESFSSDTANRAEVLKNIQVLKESEKNAEILSQLDQFISDYQSKMSAITTLSPTVSGSVTLAASTGVSQKDADLIEYNSNKDAWDAAKAAKNTAEMERLAARNEELRQKYGVIKDTGKLQTFHDGGVVRGARRGEETTVNARVGEMYINDRQQDNLFRMLNFKMPSIDFSMPSFSMPAASGGSNPQQVSSTSVTFSGDTYITDDAVAKVYWTERDNFVRRSQSRSGAK
ncbi:transglycosylase [Paenibacillus sp. FSL P4-0081]|uniref:transglycosylase n=1 Tax=Paenibacillus sp. FSL P4-0081 TaxID=1536769 RepID=UPI001E43CE8F|nr:transglycosylase [Paenibacillus sp. FSL P4-0081]